MARRALVTGGAGFIGSHLARELLARGLEVVILDDLSMGREENVPPGATLIRGDVRSAADMARAIEGAEVVFHEAARVSIRASVEHFYEDADTNFMGTLSVLRACAGSGVKRLVFASSMAVYADSDRPDPIGEDHPARPLSPYGIAKLAAERYCLQLCAEMGIDCQVLRYFNTYGPGQAFTPYVGVITIFIRRLLAGEPVEIFGDGEQRRDFTHVSDIVQANLLALDGALPAGVYNVGTGRATSVREIAGLLTARIDPSAQVIFRQANRVELRNSIADISAIAARGYRPGPGLAERIGEIVDFHRRRPSDGR